jgi:integrase
LTGRGFGPPVSPARPGGRPRPCRERFVRPRAALNVAPNDDHRLIDRNPAAGLKLPRAERKPRTWWSSAQVRRFPEATHDDRLHALWRVALLRGLRRGELLSLRWSDVDLNTKTLHVRAGKTESAQRVVSLDTETVKVLREHRRRQTEEQLATFGAYDDHDLVFAREDGTPIPPHQVTRGFQRLARHHGLPIRRFHDARHTAASIALESGIDIKVVSDQLGHSTTRVTQGKLVAKWSTFGRFKPPQMASPQVRRSAVVLRSVVTER